MKTKLILCFLTTTFLFACSSDPKKELEKNIQTPLEIYIKAQIAKDESMQGAILDSLVITKIDTVTPLYQTRIYQVKITNEMKHLEKIYDATKDVLDKTIEYNKSKNQMFKSLSSEERASLQSNTSDDEKELEEIKIKYLAYKNSVDSCQKIIDDTKTDNKTLVGYYAFFRLKVTQSDMTQKSLDAGGMQLTKDFRIIENNLEN